MISHQHRCIFVHIPRCAGTSIEQWMVGQDQWSICPQEKHLLASQAKSIYAEYWPNYFKFAFVRRPIDRVVSCLKMADHFGLTVPNNGNPEIGFETYHRYFGGDVIVEHDHRFYDRQDLVRDMHRPGCVYSNILDEPLDFIGRFECLYDDAKEIAKTLQISKSFDHHLERSETSISRDLPDATLNAIGSMYAADIVRYGY